MNGAEREGFAVAEVSSAKRLANAGVVAAPRGALNIYDGLQAVRGRPPPSLAVLPQEVLVMSNLIKLSLAAVLVAACSDQVPTAPTDQALTIPGPSFSMHMGQGAVVATNCLAPKGAQFLSIVPVSDNDWYLAIVEMVSSTCRTQPSGKHKETFSIRVLPDIPIPLPNKALRASLMDENGNPRLWDLHFPGGFFFPEPTVLEDVPLACVFDAPPNDFTFDGDFTTTPSGMHNGACTFDGS